MDTIGKLRPILDSELELMRTWRNAPTVRSKMYTQHEISVEEHQEWWNTVAQRADKLYFMYEFNAIPAGIVGFVDIDRINSNSSWLMYAAPEAPKGTGSRMLLLALDYVFLKLLLHKVHAEVLAFNGPFIKLLRKFDIQMEGTFRQQHKLADNFIDVHRFGILATEWAARRDEMLQGILEAARV